MCAKLQQAALNAHKAKLDVNKGDILASLFMPTDVNFIVYGLKHEPERRTDMFGPFKMKDFMIEHPHVYPWYMIGTSVSRTPTLGSVMLASTGPLEFALCRSDPDKAIEGMIVLIAACCAYHSVVRMPDALIEMAKLIVHIKSLDGMLTTTHWHTHKNVDWPLVMSTHTKAGDGIVRPQTMSIIGEFIKSNM